MANITYFDPFAQGWNRMKDILFRPFDISKWFILGFTAFLADLLNGHGGGGNKWTGHNHHVDWNTVADFPQTAWQWLLENAWWFGLIMFGVVVVLGIVIVFNWLSSRGKFMFLDNVVHNKAEVTKPWHDFKKAGDSLFVWRLVYGFIVLAVFIFLAGLFFSMFLGIHAAGFPTSTTISTVMGMVLIFLTFLILTGYIGLFLNDFVVPIMYKYRINAMRAWGRFLHLLRRHFWYFVLYGIFIFVLIILVVAMVIAFVLLTCCIGGILLVIPYIGSVLFLPVSVTFRAFSVAFLEQFGPEYEIFPRPAESVTPGQEEEGG